MKKAYFISVQILLFLVALGKLIGAAEWSGKRVVKDPLLTFITARQMLFLTAILELAVVVYIWRAGSDVKKAASVLWLSVLYLIYRLGWWQSGFQGYCKCLGYLGDWMRLSEHQSDVLAQFILAFMLLGSGAIVIEQLLRRK